MINPAIGGSNAPAAGDDSPCIRRRPRCGSGSATSRASPRRSTPHGRRRRRS